MKKEKDVSDLQRLINEQEEDYNNLLKRFKEVQKQNDRLIEKNIEANRKLIKAKKELWFDFMINDKGKEIIYLKK